MRSNEIALRSALGKQAEENMGCSSEELAEQAKMDAKKHSNQAEKEARQAEKRKYNCRSTGGKALAKLIIMVLCTR